MSIGTSGSRKDGFECTPESGVTAFVHCSRDESCYGLAAIRRIRDTIRFRSAKHSRYDVLGPTRNSAEIRVILATRRSRHPYHATRTRSDVCGGKESCRIRKDRSEASGPQDTPGAWASDGSISPRERSELNVNPNLKFEWRFRDRSEFVIRKLRFTVTTL